MKPPASPASARDHALLRLDATALPGWPTKRLGFRSRSSPPDDPRDYALAEKITIGVIKNLLFLRHAMSHFGDRPARRIDVGVQKILAAALYQILKLDRIPAAAAVDAAVDQAKRFASKRASGFVNAVLRRAAREREAPLPGREESPKEFARLALSHPPELFDRLLARVGDVEAALAICEHNNAEPPVLIRLNRGHAMSDLDEFGLDATPHEQPGIVVAGSVRRQALAEIASRGIGQVQDATAALAVEHMAFEADMLVLDRCCGRGTKTVQAADACEDCRIVAMDRSAEAIAALRRTIETRSLSHVAAHVADSIGKLPCDSAGPFDRMLIDAPCSNSGVLARRPEARYAQHDRQFESLRDLQWRIIEDTVPHLQPGGRLVYATCSMWPDENEHVAERIATTFPQLRLLEQRDCLPSTTGEPTTYRDGGFIAVFERSS